MRTRVRIRKPFATMMTLVLILSSILPAAQPVSARAVPAYAPPPPTQPAPAPPPAGPDVTGQPMPTPPSPDDLPPEAEDARARQAIEAVLGKYLRYWGPRYQVAPVEVTIEGGWAHGVAQWQSQARTLEEPIHILAHRLPDGAWQALMPGSDGLYLQWVDAVPESLALADEKGQLRAQAIEADALQRAVKPSMIITPTTTSLRPSLPSEPLGPLAPAPTPVPRPRSKTWIAEETSISRLSQEERTRLCGVPVEAIEWERLQASRDIAEPEAVYDYPSSVDWRNVSGQNYTTDIKSQGGCGSCTAFGTVGAIESRMEVAHGNPGLNPDLSEAHVYFCNGGDCEHGIWPGDALNFGRDTGIVDEACYPYADHNQACNPCSDWQSRVIKITDWTGMSNVDEMKQSLADHGPYEATMAVYGDFFSYTGGTYRHTWGNLEGYHAIAIVGYDDSGGYWIAKNSWGTGWGESGWFRIAYGECGIDDYAYVPDINPPSSCDPNADQVALFVDVNYNGQCIVRDVGQYPNPGAIGLPNDSISSIRVGSNVQGILCQHDNYEGICETFTGDDPDLSDNSIGNDQVSSVQVEQCSSPCNPNADQVALYADTGHGGSCVTLDIGDYPNPGYLGSLGNDDAESIKVGSNVQVTLCEHDDYQGRCETFTGDDSNLGDNYIGANVVSSVRVQSRDTTPPTGQITSPSDGAVISTCPLTIQAEASDDQSGVSHVEFHAYYDSDWHHLGDDYTSPYSWNWDCSSISDQGVWLTIHVWDNAGNEVMDPGGYVYITLSSPTVGPLVYDSHIIDDDNNDQSSGNDDGIVNCGETIELYVALYNQGNDTASGVNVTISTSDPYVTWLYNTDSSYPTIAGGGTETNISDFDFAVDPSTPDGRIIHFDLDVIASNGGPWSDSFDVPVTCTSCNDPHESNDVPGQATSIHYGATLSDPDICPAGDVDYYAFVGNGGDAIVADIDAQAIGSALDPYLYLYDTDGVTELTHNDDYDGLDSHIEYTLPADGVYYLMVREYNHPNEGGPDYFYTISLTGTASVGPIVYDGHTIDDDDNGESSGDGDAVVECGENIELYVTLRNLGDSTATAVNAAISTADPYVTWLYNTDSAYPDIAGGGTGSNNNDFDFAVDPNTPDGHVVQFDLDINAANGGPWPDSFSLSVACPRPDLTPSQWGGWEYPIVPASITGTSVVNTLYVDYITYVDWGISNSGDADCGGDAYGDLYLDDTPLASYNFGDVQAGWTWAFFDWGIIVDTPGWHTLKFVADEGALISESNETNNAWERDFYWTPVAPFFDDVESGANDWTATGLWHQVDEYTSPYPESYSWSHSWWYGQDATGNYDTGAANSGDLTAPPVYVPSTGYYLRFWYWYETETQGQSWDQRWVQISVDDGPFENVLQMYDDPKEWWLQSPAIDLSDYTGHTIQVRFHFDTIDSGVNDYRGWYIDDFEISTTPPPGCADTHEPNDIPAEATAIAYGQTFSADMCPGGDYDFYQFTGAEGDKVVVDIDAQVNGSLLDSYVFLLDSDGASVLAEHDDEIPAEVQDSHLGYQLPHDGTYYIKVKAWDHPSAGSVDHFYTIHLLTDDAAPSAEITSPAPDSWLDPNLQTVTTDVSDGESGIRNVIFYWHDADWDNSNWIILEDDWDPRDGWTYEFDTSSIPEQVRGCVVFIYALDWAGNYAGYGSYGLGIDRTPPTTTVSIQQMYGDAPFRDFWVNWWGNYDDTSGIADYDVQYRDGTSGVWTGLMIGTTDVYTRFVGLNGHTYYFRARARDNAGNESAYSGDVQHTVDICDTPPDAYETDDTSGSARWITTGGVWQTHNVHAEGDQDWTKFDATAGVTYTIATTNTGGHADTVLYLYDTDGSTLIVSNDDYPGMWPSSRLDWQPSTSGIYYVKVDHWDPWAYGCTTEYGLSVAAGNANCNDPHEPNDVAGQATSISYGATLSADICPAGDVDYYAFTGSAGDAIVADIDAQASGSALDSYLYDADGVTELAHNDDHDSLDSYIAYVLPAAGTYYLMVREYNQGSEGGPDYFYTLSLSLGPPPFDVDAGWTSSAPSVDGQISPGEWADAAIYDITAPEVRASTQRDLMTSPEMLLQDQKRTPALPKGPLSTVTLYAMNDGTHLYLAIDNPNDTTIDTYDQIGVYFDDNPLPSDGQWTNGSCGNPYGEGNFWVITDTVTYREIVAGPTFCTYVEPAPGTSGAFGHGSGHAQVEIVIDLTSSALRATPGDAIGMYLWIYDADTGTLAGQWPVTAGYDAPSTYRSLTLARSGDVGPLAPDGYTVDDDTAGESDGDGDGIVDCGEAIELYVDLYNRGGDTATGVEATISTTDPYITFTHNTDSGYPDVPGGGSGANNNDFDFQVAPDTPDGHVIHFDLDVTASNGGPWAGSFDVPVTCEGGQAQWTFMVYLDGDNNLEGAGIDDFLEMSSVGSGGGVNILVQFDRIPGYDANYGDWTDTRRFYVTSGLEPWPANGVSIGEANMGDPQTLIDFVQWGMTNYPADHYAVVLWDHGSGWRLRAEDQPLIKDIAYDDTSGGDGLDMPELRGVMDTLSNGGADPLDLVGFDACLMGMIEVDDQLIPYVDVRVGAEDTEPWDGWPYDTLLSALRSDPTMSAAQLGTVIVDAYYASYGDDQTQSAVNLGNYATLNTAADELAAALIAGVGDHYAEIAAARGNTQEFAYSTYIDLYDFAYQINQHVSDAAIAAAATDVMNAIGNAVIREQHGGSWAGAHGISIYFPESEGLYNTTYDGSAGWLQFTIVTQWDEWLHTFYDDVVCNDPHEPNDAPGQAASIGYGSTLNADICPAGDVDYYAFTGSAGDTIVADIDAQASGSALDSYLYLYDTDGTTELAHNDDHDGLDSRIEYTLPAAGTYYLKVREYSHGYEGGPDYFYTLSLTGGGSGDVGPVVYDGHAIDDDTSGESDGNDDGVVDCGETIELYVNLHNQGSGVAIGVNATLTTTDPYVSAFLYNDTSGYPDIAGGGTAQNTNDWDLTVDPSTPDGHVIHFDLDITASNGGPWIASFDVPVTCYQSTAYILSTSVNPGGSGSVTADPPPNSGGGYLEGTVVQLTAVPAWGYDFESWSGDVSGSDNPITIVMDTDKSVTANFTSIGAGPHLSIPDHIPAYAGQEVVVPVAFTDNGHDIASTIFSLDFDENCLAFDPTDGDQDGLPDAVTFDLSGGFNGSVTFDGSDIDGELDFYIADVFPPLGSLLDGSIVSVTLDVTCQPTSTAIAPVGFSDDPPATFGNISGQSVPGTTSGGSVEILAGMPGDCNGDQSVDAGDIPALVLEIFDGDGNAPANTPGGSFAGDPIGCNANGDTTVDAGDISSLVLLIFGSAGTHSAVEGLTHVAEGDGPVLALPGQVATPPGASVTLPITFTGNGSDISVAIFSLDYDQTWLDFSPTDSDEDGIPDAVTFNLPAGFDGAAMFDRSDTDGELDFYVADTFPPLTALPDGVIAFVTVEAGHPSTTTKAAVNFSQEPAASFGDTFGQGVAGTTGDGAILITIAEGVHAGFTASPTTGVAPLMVTFTDTSTGTIDAWSWDFGDGVTSTLQSLTHTYTTKGVYPVTLTVSGPGGSDDEVKAGYITVYESVSAAFTASPTSGARPLVVTFANQSTGDYTASLWDFGDSLTSTLQSPTHTYSIAGTFTVSLTVSGPGGSDASVRERYITVSERFCVYLPVLLRCH